MKSKKNKIRRSLTYECIERISNIKKMKLKPITDSYSKIKSMSERILKDVAIVNAKLDV